MRLARFTSPRMMMQIGVWVFALTAVSAARAATITVNTLVDENDGVGSGGISLRDAINEANSNGEDDTIAFSVTGTITLTADLPNITSNVDIEGPGANNLSVDGDSTYRIFVVMGSSTEVAIRDLTLANAHAQGGDGEDTENSAGFGGGGAGGGAAGMGAALFINDGTVQVSNVTFEDNAVIGGTGGDLSNTASNLPFGGGGGGVGGDGTSNDGGDGGFLGGSGGEIGYVGETGGDGAGGGAGSTAGTGGDGGFGGGGGGGGGGSMDSGGDAGPGGFGGGGGGGGENDGGSSGSVGGAGGDFGGDGGDGTDDDPGTGGGGAGLGGAVFVRAGDVELLNCAFNRNSATGGAAGDSDATAGDGKGGAVFVNSGATVAELNCTYGTGSDANSASDDTATSGDNDDIYGTIAAMPTVQSIARQDDEKTNDGQVTFEVTYSKAVTGVGTDDFELITTGNVSGASIVSANSISSNTVFAVVVNTGTGDGTIDLKALDDDSIQDGSAFKLGGAGSDNGEVTANAPYSIDKTRPAVTSITTVTSSPTNATTVSFNVVFSETVTGFNAAADIEVETNGTSNEAVSITQQSGTTYRVSITGVDGDGTIKATVKAGAATDTAGNTNASVAASDTVTVDTTAPAIASIDAPTTVDDFGRLIFTVTFAEAVTGLTSDDITINHDGTAHESISIEADSATVYRLIVAGVSGSGSATATINANAVTDSAGNGNAAMTSDAVAISDGDGGDTDGEDETDGGEIMSGGGLCGASMPMMTVMLLPLMVTVARRRRWKRCHATKYFFVLLALSFSTATVNAATITVDTLVDENDGVGTGGISLRDAINEANSNGEDDTIAFSVTGTITLTADLPSITTNVVIDGPGTSDLEINGDDQFRVFVVLGSSSNLTIRALTISNAYATGGDGGNSQFGGAGGGAAGIGAGLFQNDGTVRLESMTFQDCLVDGGNGGASGDSGAGNSGGGGGGIGGSGADGTLSLGGNGGSGGVLGGAAGVGGSTPTVGGEGAGGGGATQASSGNDGAAGGFGGGGGGAGYTVGMGAADGGTAGFGGGGAGADNGTPGTGGTHGGDGNARHGGGGAGLGGAIFVRAGTLAMFDCTFNSNTATGGTKGGGSAEDGEGKGGAIYVHAGATVEEFNTTFGTGGDANSATDDSASSGDDDDVFGTISTMPIVDSITRQDATTTNDGQVTFEVTFSEAVSGVGTDDFELVTTGSLAGASIVSANSISGNTVFAVVVNTGTGDGTIDLKALDDDSIQNGSAIKLGGTGSDNGEKTANAAYIIDKTRPTISSVTAVTSSPTNANTVLFNVVFSETVTGFDSASDIEVETNGTSNDAVSISQQSGTTYRVNVTGVDGDGTVKATVKAGAARDTAGNTNASVAASNTVTIDNTVPAINSIITPTSIDAFDRLIFTVTFSQAVTGFTSDDITVNHDGTAHESVALEADSTTIYRVIVAGVTGSGTVSITVNDNAATDSANNGNAATTSDAVTIASDEDDMDGEDETEMMPSGSLCGASMPMMTLMLLPLMALARRKR